MKLVTRQAIALSQISLSVLFVGGYFYVLLEFVHGHISVPIEWKDVLQSLLALLTAGVLQVLHFWFSRSRPSDDPKDAPPVTP
jgi:ABC-type anion transport system duplicated permease subunit